jgi:hypothetical protein
MTDDLCACTDASTAYSLGDCKFYMKAPFRMALRGFFLTDTSKYVK